MLLLEDLPNVSAVSVTVALLALVSCSRGIDPKETKQYQAQIVLRQQALATRADLRVKNGETAPKKVDYDNGLSLAVCSPLPADDGFIMQVPFMGYEVICYNSPKAVAIVEWRKWYCEGEKRTCVTGVWRNGQPTFRGGGSSDKISVNLGGGDMVTFSDPNFEWPVR